MRPEILYPLFAPVTTLSGVGPRIAKSIDKAAGPRIVDLFWHLPNGIIDRRHAPRVADAEPGVVATMTVRVVRHQKPGNPRRPYKVYCADDSGTLALVFFHARPDYLRRVLPEGETRVVSGTVEIFGREIQITHPDHIGTLEELDRLQAVEPVYPLTAGLTLKVLGRAVRAALEKAPGLDEWIDRAFLARHGWKPWHAALGEAHAPADAAALEPTSAARQRLAFDELLANQLALALVRANMRRVAGRGLEGDGRLRRKVTQALPFRLTGSQEKALDDIAADMAADARMLRLLQGDVGSGKTVVAFLSMLNAVECGAQAVLMAPTDILARQHLAAIEPLAAAAGVTVALLTGREKGRQRKTLLDDLAGGQAALAVGTHALFQDDVAFHDLALAVIDEQHRFGVHQRLTLAAKGRAADVLVMTATPIPRTLMLTAYGDMDESRLLEKPAGRPPVDTRVMPLGRLDDVIAAVARAVDGGGKVYWVCPLVEESEALDAAAAEERYGKLAQVFGERVGLLHGRLKGADKDAAMQAFAAGTVDLLVCTTVVEVGMDVPAATVMVIEHAERFGLSQLHQLRGRIGRGTAASTCLLLYAAPLTETARGRLAIMRQTNDGFRIAEEDLRLRGAGELLGTRQSGMPEFRLADLAAHAELLAAARDDAGLILGRDADLTSARGRALRTLLYLFERDAAVKYLRSG
ncbi:MAG: ATP-dependent DNA helicase RecG [Proteobacteria bacterium]|nr:ATP-dependent DNA helicase RecG [Pseudomonadota bacterium]